MNTREDKVQQVYESEVRWTDLRPKILGKWLNSIKRTAQLCRLDYGSL